MIIKRLSVKNYRNLAEQTLEFCPNLNIFAGNNAQGKTNLLESVYLCCLGKSPRTDRDKDMINWSETRAKTTVDFDTRAGEKQVSVTLAKEKKYPSLNGIPMAKIGEILGHLNCVYFSPDEIRVVTASPHERRRFLDIDLCQTDKTYYHSLLRFNRILMQRNNLLKKAKRSEDIADILSVWDMQLAEEGARLTWKRREFCSLLAPKASAAHKTLTKTENMELQYISAVAGKTPEEMRENYKEKLAQNLEKDFNQRFTTYGSQRDDIKFSAEGTDIRSFGSQGQQRTAALALKLAELELFNELKGEYPVLLLDDVMSELDRSRQKALISFNGNVQIILTATKVDAALIKKLPYKKFTVKNGKATVI